jgi:hypothetical protein
MTSQVLVCVWDRVGLRPYSRRYTSEQDRRADARHGHVSVPVQQTVDSEVVPLYRARFPTEIYTRGCHWFPRLLA